MEVKSYRDLIVWQKAMDLVELVYRQSRDFPREELYGLTNQLRRAAVSIPSNIAEGRARQTTKDFLHFLSITQGSLAEVETQVVIAQRLCYADTESTEKILRLTGEVGRLLHGLRNSLAQLGC